MSELTTQSLGKLILLDSGAYEPVNQNKGRFLFEPKGGSEEEWVTLIDGRVPALNEGWRGILARDSAKVAEALAVQGLSYEDSASQMALRHVRLFGDEKAELRVSLGESEEGFFLEVKVDENDRVCAAEVNR